MSENFEDQEAVQDEVTSLKQRADMLGISYHPSIGLQKLRSKVRQALEEQENAEKEESVEYVEGTGETPQEFQARKRREASALVRIRVSCMNPLKKEYEGEIFTAGNSVVGMFTKYVPFNNDEGWHVPTIIYKMIKERQCQIFVTAKDARGNRTSKAKLIKEFNVEVLPPLTPEELKELAERQAATHAID